MNGAPGTPSFRPVRLLCTALVLLGLCTGVSRAAWVTLGGNEGAGVEVRLVEETAGRIVLDYTIPGFYAEAVQIGTGTYYAISLPGEGRFLDRGLPGLPRVTRSLIIPDAAQMTVHLLESDVVELRGYPVAPSKGDLLRTVDPSAVPYAFDPIYGEPVWWPRESVNGGVPYILRDHRGMTVEVFPLLASGPGGLLRAARHMRIEIVSEGLDRKNVLLRPAPARADVPEFAGLYEKHFLNWKASRYVPVPEAGGMLVIAADSLVNTMLPFVEWKRQTGIPTRIVGVSAVGNSEAQIDAYIDSAYYAEGLAYVLLVGDAEQVATAYAAGGASDPTYSLIAGDDSYPEVFIGRLSAASVADLQTQVDRSIEYERNPAIGAAWYGAGTGVASAEGPGDNGEYDFQHADVIRAKLLSHTYTEVDRIYDPGATASTLSAALNAGRGIVNYTGHGSSIGWGTTGFSTQDVAALTNDRMLPFIFSVGCVNGAFPGGTCFAETWLRAQHDGNPTGAIGTYMSSVNQTWDPPMSAQDAFVDLLVGGQMHTIGGLCANASCRMMDTYGTAGANMFRTWHLFGDPSLQFRTAAPEAMTVLRADSIFVGEVDYPLTVESTDGARCALYANGILYGSSMTDPTGAAVIHMDPTPTVPMTLTLTITASNKIPTIVPVEVLPLSGPTLVLSDVSFRDGQTGNGDGVLGPGELIDLSIALRNTGVAAADSVTATVATADPYAQVDFAVQPFGRIVPDSTAPSAGPYVIVVRGDAPDQHVVSFNVGIQSTQKHWTRSFSLTIAAPLFSAGSVLIDDTAPPGDGDGEPDPGEAFFVELKIVNSGTGGARALQGLLSCSHPGVRILDDAGECLFAPSGGEGDVGSFRVRIGEGCPIPGTLPFHLSLSGKGGLAAELDYPVQIGQWSDDAEVDRGWTVGLPEDTATGGRWLRADPVGTTVDAQVAQPEDDHTAGGAGVLCFVTGNGVPGGAAQDADVDGGETTLLSPVFRLGGAVSAALDYWRWYTNGLIGGPDQQDFLSVEVTSNGIDWVPIEHTALGASQWRHVTRALEEYVELTDHVQIRFIVEDHGAESLVEAAVDDLTLTVVRAPVTDARPIEEHPTAAFISCDPNPLGESGQITYRVNRAGQVRLELYDVAGRLVRSLLDGPTPAGERTARLDAAGIPTGVYFVRLAAPDLLQTRRITILH
jgi:hypothetical protein